MFLPIDIANVDAVQLMYNSKVGHAWHEIVKGVKVWDDPESYTLSVHTIFGTSPLNASGVKCNNVVLPAVSGLLYSDFHYLWQPNTGPLPYTDLCWEFTRDGQTVYDTIPMVNDVGHITFSSDYISPLNGVTMLWENASGGGDIILAIRINYGHPTNDNLAPLSNKNAIHIPNTGSFTLSKAVLESEFGAEFNNPNKTPWYLDIFIVKGNYKFKNYGVNNDKTLLTTAFMLNGTMIMFEQ